MASSCGRIKSNVTRLLVFLAAVFMAFVPSANGEAAPVATCNTTGCTIVNVFGWWPDRVPCHAASVVYPKTEDEIIQAVAYAAKNGLKIKAGSRLAHAMPKLICPGGNEGIFLSTSNYASVVSIDKQAQTVTAQAGVQLQELLDTIAKSGLALAQVPYWSGLSLAGLLSTGAHGSSLFGRGGAVHEYVVGMRLVVPAQASQGYARVVTLTEEDEDLKAARLSLGVLGVISTITLQLRPLFKRSVTLEVEDDADLDEKIEAFSRKYEFGDVRWLPSQRKVIYRLDKSVPLSTPGNGVITRFGGNRLSNITAARKQEDQAEASKQEKLKCSLAKSLLNSGLALGGGWANNETTFTGYPVVGFQNDMQANNGCLTTSAQKEGLYCDWDRQINGRKYFETATYVPVRNLSSLVNDVKTLRKKVPGSFCNVDAYDSGILFRFVKKSNRAYLGAAPSEDVAEVNFDYYRGYDFTTPTLDEDVVQELEQICLHKYRAKPHWGKNRNVAFEGVAKRFPDLGQFLQVKKRYDPSELFSSEWSDAILGINKNGAPGVTKLQPYCALEGLCICSRDEHCAPEQNYYCRPGRIFSKARVCRYEPI